MIQTPLAFFGDDLLLPITIRAIFKIIRHLLTCIQGASPLELPN